MFSAYDAIVELNQVMYSLGHSRFIGDPWQGQLVRTKLYNALEGMTADLSDEISYALDEYFGTDTDNWTEIELVETLNHVAAQLAGRFTVGLPLCMSSTNFPYDLVHAFLVNHNQKLRNTIANRRHLGRSKDYIDTCCEISDDFMLVGGVRGLPHILRPLVGTAMGIWFKTKIKKMKKLFEPLYHERIATLQHSTDDPEHEEPNDYLQIMFRYAADQRQEELASVDVMTRRLIVANFGSIHQPSLLIANTLLNIIDSDAEFNTIATLRDELISVFGVAPDGTTPDIADHSIWTKFNINKLHKADSLMRETTRLHTFGSRAMLRKVMPKDGVTTDTGVHLPQGTLVSFMAHPVQMDEETFDNPNGFDPFRFSRMHEKMEAKKTAAKEPAEEGTNATNEINETNDTNDVAKVGPLKFVTTSPNHLTFGHGRHACPGRFVVDFQLKMIIAHVITRYELGFPKEYNGRRPENSWIADVKLPRHAKIRVRRKKLAC